MPRGTLGSKCTDYPAAGGADRTLCTGHQRHEHTHHDTQVQMEIPYRLQGGPDGTLSSQHLRHSGHKLTHTSGLRPRDTRVDAQNHTSYNRGELIKQNGHDIDVCKAYAVNMHTVGSWWDGYVHDAHNTVHAVAHSTPAHGGIDREARTRRRIPYHPVSSLTEGRRDRRRGRVAKSSEGLW